MKLRFSRPVKLLIAAGCIAVVILAHLMTLGEVAPLYRSIRDSLHAPGFALFTGVAIVLLRAPRGSWWAYLRVMLLVLAVAVIAESSQMFTGRDASLTDFRADLLGIGSVTLLFVAMDRHLIRHTLLSLALILPAVAGIALCFMTPLRLGAAVLEQATRVPVLLNFDPAWETRLINGGSLYVQKVDAALISPDMAGLAGRIRLDEASERSFEFAPYSDWRGYTEFTFVAASGNHGPMQLSIRIHDRAHNSQFGDRFTKTLSISPEATLYRLPLDEVRSTPSGRLMDLGQIESVVFFTARSEDSDVLILDNVQLR